MRFEIYPWKDGTFGMHLEGNNGEVVMHSEGYQSIGNARRAIKAVKAGVKAAPVVVTEGKRKGRTVVLADVGDNHTMEDAP